MKSSSLLIVCLVAILVIGALAVAQSYRTVFERSVTVHALAVSGNSGAVINIRVIMLYPGDGKVYVATTPLPYGPEGTLFITSSQLALYIASTIAGVNPDNYSFLIRPESNLIMIGGPSASAYITCAMYALLTNSSFREDVTMTGMILPGGIVGPVGGVPLKIEAAARRGFKVVLVPALNYLTLSPSEIPPGIKVVPVSDVYHAIEYLTGRKLVYTNVTISDLRKIPVLEIVTRYLWYLILRRFNSTVNLASIPQSYRSSIVRLYEEATRLAKEGDYYTAASTLYRALIEYYTACTSIQVDKRGISYLYDLRNEIADMLNNVESELHEYSRNLNPLSVDLIVGIYDRVGIARELLRDFERSLSSGDLSEAIRLISEAKARVETLYDWLKVLNKVQAETTVGTNVISKLSRLYIEFLKSLIGYSELVQTYGLEKLTQKIADLEELYRSGQYLKALGLSFMYSSEITGNIVEYYVSIMASQSSSRASELISYAEPIRQVILSELWKLSKSNMTSLFAYMYLEYGDYYLNKARQDLSKLDMTSFSVDIALAYRFYTSALLHLMLLKSIMIESGIKKVKLIIKERPSGISSYPSKENITNITSVSTGPASIKFRIGETTLAIYISVIVAMIVLTVVLLSERKSYLASRESQLWRNS